MAFTREYPAGTDYRLYITDPLSESEFIPNFNQEEAIDVAGVRIQEDGNVLPLYDVAQRTPEHFAYSRRMVNGVLQFNFSPAYVKRWRSKIQNIRDKTLWVELNYVRWKPLQIVRDVFRISDVWEHAFTHSPNPHAMEQVPFSGRDMTLLERQTADIRSDINARLLSDLDEKAGIGSTDDLFTGRRASYVGKVTRVVDGDTLECYIEGIGKTATIRIASADTPETRKDPGAGGSRNSEGGLWAWPSAPREDSGQRPEWLRNPSPDSVDRGTYGQSPTIRQLNDWGDYVRDRVRDWFGADAQGNVADPKYVILERDPGTAPRDQFGRNLFKVRLQPRPTDPIPEDRSIFSVRQTPEWNSDILQAGTNPRGVYLSEFLVRLGYAIPFPADSFGVLPNGALYSHRTLLSEINKTLRTNTVVGKRYTERTSQEAVSAAGVYYSHDPALWHDYLEDEYGDENDTVSAPSLE